MQLLGGLTPQQFLLEYWQKKPLLIRQAIPGFESPLTAEELAGYACEEEVESRIIIERSGESPWELNHGPFTEDFFTTLPDSHWTLLIQQANQIIPQLAEFLQKFDFIPAWRTDDIMVSYAAKQGSVGPHLDQYDVFLLQGLGQRRWQINTDDLSTVEWTNNTDLKILKHFESQQEWILEPGDMLYLPPNVAHSGVALNDCITYSIGFRTPSISELLTSYVDDYVSTLSENERFTDKDLTVQQHTGEISTSTLDKIKNILQQSISQPEQISSWFGKYITETQLDLFEIENPMSQNEVKLQLQQQDILYRSEYSRFAYTDMGLSILLYVDGTEYSISQKLLPLVQLLCDKRIIQIESIRSEINDPLALELLTQLYNRSAIWFDLDDD